MYIYQVKLLNGVKCYVGNKRITKPTYKSLTKHEIGEYVLVPVGDTDFNHAKIEWVFDSLLSENDFDFQIRYIQYIKIPKEVIRHCNDCGIYFNNGGCHHSEYSNNGKFKTKFWTCQECYSKRLKELESDKD